MIFGIYVKETNTHLKKKLHKQFIIYKNTQTLTQKNRSFPHGVFCGICQP